MKIDSFEKNTIYNENSLEILNKNNQTVENLENSYNDYPNNRDEFDNSYKIYPSDYNCNFEHLLPTNKNNNQKIFSTTVIEKKKNINFKVIKNKNKEENFISNYPTQNYINNFQLLNKFNNKNNYYTEVNNNNLKQIIHNNQNENLRKENILRRLTNNTSTSGMAYKTNNFNEINLNLHNYSLINSNTEHLYYNSGYQHNPHEISNRSIYEYNSYYYPKKKLKQRTSFYYLEILINAAEKIVQEGNSYHTQDNSNNNESEKQNKFLEKNFTNTENHHSSNPADNENNSQHESNSFKEIKINNSESNSPSNQRINPHCSIRSNSMNNMNSINNIKFAQNIIGRNSGKCGNKSCESHKNIRKINLLKIRACKGKILRLCHNCVEAWNNKQYCYFCLSIYRDTNINSYVDDKKWILCDSCDSSWQHIQCEEKKGNYYSNLHKLLDDNNFKYFCPHCRAKKNENKKNDNFLKHKRNKSSNRNQNENHYRKVYNINLKYSNSRRIKEKNKQIFNNDVKYKQQEQVQEPNYLQNELGSSDNFCEVDTIIVKKKKESFSSKRSSNIKGNEFSSMNENDNSLEIIQDIHKIKDNANFNNLSLIK